MIYNLTIDLNETVANFYPGLSESDVKLIASEIYNVWDYSSQYQLIADRIDEMACIEGKWSPVEKKNEDGTLTSGKRNISKDQVGHINFKNCEVKE